VPSVAERRLPMADCRTRKPTPNNVNRLARLDQQYVWHPFTQMREWLAGEPVVIVEGRGAVLRDVYGHEYLDGNSTIWTNLHGHDQPRINAAVRRQLRKIAHVSALGLANEPASLLAARLVEAANPVFRPPPASGRRTSGRKEVSRASLAGGTTELCPRWDRVSLAARARSVHEVSTERAPRPTGWDVPRLAKVFYSDDGSTAVEVALKLAYEYARRSGLSSQPRFLSLAGAYHGDTVGAVSLGHIDLFHRAYGGLLFGSDQVMAPYCYRCPFNRAKPERADAREYRRCRWECVREFERRCRQQRRRHGAPYAGFVFEPRIQGAAGMVPQPDGWLARAAEIARGHGTLLIADEVMTGFGRTGGGVKPEVGSPKSEVRSPKSEVHEAASGSGHPASDPLFACQVEGVQPDFLCLAKGLTGGYLPMAATLTTEAVFGAFLGEYGEFKTFFHGHSYTANPLGAAAALASLDLLDGAASARARRTLEEELATTLGALWSCPNVGDVRRVGLVVGVELVRNWRTREPFGLRERAGIRVCEAMARRGVLTRPIGNVVVLMPPYCTTPRQAGQMVAALREAVDEVL